MIPRAYRLPRGIFFASLGARYPQVYKGGGGASEPASSTPDPEGAR
jgi:hypothetical protein